jgi:23S rRNA pseudouridine2605 synthase
MSEKRRGGDGPRGPGRGKGDSTGYRSGGGKGGGATGGRAAGGRATGGGFKSGQFKSNGSKSGGFKSGGFKSGGGQSSGPARGRRTDDRGEASFRPRSARGDGAPRADDRSERKPFRPREEGDRKPYRSREDGDRKSFRPRAEGDRKPYRPRAEGDRKPFRARGEIPAPRPAEPDRIAKVMARAGLCSRRDAEDWILAGRVSVNGQVIDSPALDVTPADVVLVDGQPLPERERTRLWLHHKPPGLVTTASDPEGRPTVFDNLPPGLPRVISIGRLDINTEGLLLLTNDGGLARVLAHPSTGWLRRYRVRAYGKVTQDQLDPLKEGSTVDGIDYGPITATIDREQGDNTWLTLDLREGKNREVKEVLGALGLQVNRLIRVSFGPFQLGDIKPGEVDEVPRRLLRDQLGERLAAEAEVDLEGPRFDRPDDRTRDRERSAPAGRFDADGDGGKPLLKPGVRGVDMRTRSPNVYRAEGDLPPRRGKRLDKDAFGEKRKRAVLGEDKALKVEREAIADRRGRTVKVERIITEAPPEPEPRAPRREGRTRDDFKARGTAERKSGEHRARKPRGEGGRDGFRGKPAGDRGFRSGEDGERRGRDSGPRAGGQRPFRARPPRDDRPPREDRAPRGDRPPRSGEGPRRFTRDERPARSQDGSARFPHGDRPPRSAEGGERQSGGFKSGGFKGGGFKGPPRGDGPRSSGPRPGGTRPGGSRSGPRDGGKRPPRNRG